METILIERFYKTKITKDGFFFLTVELVVNNPINRGLKIPLDRKGKRLSVGQEFTSPVDRRSMLYLL